MKPTLFELRFYKVEGETERNADYYEIVSPGSSNVWLNEGAADEHS